MGVCVCVCVGGGAHSTDSCARAHSERKLQGSWKEEISKAPSSSSSLIWIERKSHWREESLARICIRSNSFLELTAACTQFKLHQIQKCSLVVLLIC